MAACDVEDLAQYHRYTAAECERVRSQLLDWYDKEQRDLPWRQGSRADAENPRPSAHGSDADTRAYAVWVSEIMLQQTRVTTVISYYKRWMGKWPTLADLAAAELEEVNQVWAGLGYYSRGRRLHEGARKVVTELGGSMPRTAAELAKQLPGVGQYTAHAIASIAFGQPVGVVDGNVVRVLTRHRAIGALSSSKEVVQLLWDLAGTLVSPERPGDFNQALMELGATVCTPQSPSCATCPVRDSCHARGQAVGKRQQAAASFFGRASAKSSRAPTASGPVHAPCALCSPPGVKVDCDDVTRFPYKAPKKKPREEDHVVLSFARHDPKEGAMVWLTKGGEAGLLANLWQFPMALLAAGGGDTKVLDAARAVVADTEAASWDMAPAGSCKHVFSHIKQTYHIVRIDVPGGSTDDATLCGRWITGRWFACNDLGSEAVPSNVHKIIKTQADSSGRSPATGKDAKASTSKRKDAKASTAKRKDAKASTATKKRTRTARPQLHSVD